MKKSKIMFGGAVLAFISAVAYATTSFTVPWYNNPYAYEADTYGGCYWKYTTSTGGTWGSQFKYVPNGTCAAGYTSMQINHSSGVYNATAVLN